MNTPYSIRPLLYVLAAAVSVLASAIFAAGPGANPHPHQSGSPRPAPPLLALMYHHFTATARPDPASPYDMPIARFEAQLAELSRQGYKSLSTQEALAVARGTPTDGPAVLITIDDGYRSALTLAAPLLRKYSMRATLFVTTDPTAFVFDPADPLTQRLTDDELRCLDANVFDVQSHGVTHAPLRSLSDTRLTRELQASRATLESLTARPVTCLAVPGNWYDARVLRFARQAGYEAVFVSDKGVITPGADLFRLPRHLVQGYKSLRGFRTLLSGAAVSDRD